ncbi:putative odorant receptor 92a [Belonocnema kinseyi]|uniref:putative odorant receptor 92a n=1 Tax=Belonocnema kinseyi TaxID=2817044 RepID=UPI00143D2262|nr:putative odorant receptor 92a [Belonocnema kinseyi]
MSNKFHESFLKYSVRGCRAISLLIGLWPMGFSPIQKIMKFILNFTCCFLLSFVFISSVLHGSLVMKDLEQKVKLTGPTSFLLMCISKYTLLMYRGKGLEKCLSHIQEDWKQIKDKEQVEVMTKNAKFGDYLTIVSAIFMYCGGFWFHFLRPFIAEAIVTEKNITIKPYPAPVFGTFFTNGYSPIYEIVFAAHLITGFVEYSATVSAFSFAAVLALHACGQFDVVMLLLHDIVSGDKQKHKSVRERLKVTVDRHLRVLSFVSRLEDLLCEVCLIEVFGCTLNLCLLGYYIITEWKQSDITSVTTYSLILLSFIFNIFIYCYIGELLTSQAAKVGQSAYMIRWYNLPRSVSLDIIPVIRISHNPAKLTAGKIITLSMNTFSSVIRSSAAYFNVLWRMAL